MMARKTLQCAVAASLMFGAALGPECSAQASLQIAPQAAQQVVPEKKIWKSVPFAIVRFDDDAPASWSLYHPEKRGLLLIRLWKRYLLVRLQDQEVYEVDPSTVKAHGDDVEWSSAEVGEQPLEITEWKERNVGPVQRVRFRLGKNGHVLELQLPLRPSDGKSAY